MTFGLWCQLRCSRAACDAVTSQWSNLRTPFNNNACVNKLPLFQAKRNNCQWQSGNTAHSCITIVYVQLIWQSLSRGGVRYTCNQYSNQYPRAVRGMHVTNMANNIQRRCEVYVQPIWQPISRGAVQPIWQSISRVGVRYRYCGLQQNVNAYQM